MADKFIIVKRDPQFRDIGVVTGALTLMESPRLVLWKDHPLVLCEAEISEHVEHAFIFPGPWQAWRWIDRLAADENFGPRIAFMTFDVRKFPDFALGEQKTWGQIQRVDARAAGAAIYGTGEALHHHAS